MITKIEIDGKPRIAVVLGECTTIDDILTYCDSVLALLRGCFMESDDNATKEAVYNSLSLVKELQPSTNQVYAMQRAYFKETETHAPDNATPQQCKVWL